MALNFYSNWPSSRLQLNHDATYSVFRPPPELPPELFDFHDNFTLSDTSINPLFEPKNYNNHSNFNTYNPTNVFEYPTLSTNYSDVHHFSPPPPPPTTQLGFPPPLDLEFCGYAHEAPYNQLPCSVPFIPSLLDGQFPLPEMYVEGGGRWGSEAEDRERGVEVKKGRLSAQSMAARVRRRKISEKTGELGKLIPGGHKMNTAEMFQSAYKYIKFLQAQIAILKHVNTFPEGSEEVLKNGELQALVTSPSVQEKLYAAEKCIVPKHLEQILTDDQQTRPISLPLKED